MGECPQPLNQTELTGQPTWLTLDKLEIVTSISTNIMLGLLEIEVTEENIILG